MQPKTVVSMEGQSFRINGEPTYPGREYDGMKIEGLLMNARLVQGIFDDLNPETRSKFDYPDGPWDADRNTSEFVAAMPTWRAHGLLSFTINLQGGSPEGYSPAHPWHNSTFTAEGDLRDAYLERLARILDKADELGMAPILGLFYFGQDQRLTDEEAVIRGVGNATDWLVNKGYTNVMVEIANEVCGTHYDHEIIRAARCHELIQIVIDRSAGKVPTELGHVPVGTAMSPRCEPTEAIAEVSDIILLHGNGMDEPDLIRELVDRTRAVKTYRDQPILFNEDDHFDFDAPDNNMLAAVSRYASWGLFDYRMKGEGYDEGFQSVPANWGISSQRKRGFFGLLAKLTGGDGVA